MSQDKGAEVGHVDLGPGSLSLTLPLHGHHPGVCLLDKEFRKMKF